MKRKFTKAIALILGCVLLTLSCPIVVFAENTAELQGKKGSDFTTNTYIGEKLQFLFEELPYSEYPYFTVEGNKSCGNALCTKCALANVSREHPVLKDNGLTFDVTAYSSDAFARYAFATIFGTKIQSMNIFGNTVQGSGVQTVGRVAANTIGISGNYEALTVENLKNMLKKATTGDLLQARSSKGGKHTMMFLSATDVSVTVFHAVDYTLGEIEKNKVVITEMSYEEMALNWDHVISHLRAYDEVYNATWAKGDSAHTTHVYTDEGQNKCTVCGKEIDPLPTVTSGGAGVYKAKNTTTAYKGYYRSTGKAGTQIAKGEFIEVLGSVRNATGKVFYKLPNGYFAAEEDFEKQLVGIPKINIGKYPEGILKKGSTFNLTGTVTDGEGLRFVRGYLLDDKGNALQKDTATPHSNSYDIRTGVINQSLHFETLKEGNYVYLIVASSENQTMASFMSEFSIAVSTEKPTPSAPLPPTLATVTSSTVTLTAVKGYEYSMDGRNWYDSPVFTGLSPNIQYTFYQRIGETSTMNASPRSGALLVTTNKTVNTTVPPQPTLVRKTVNSIELKAISGYEYSINGKDFQKSPLFENLKPNETYACYQRIAATNTSNPSKPSEPLYVVTRKESNTVVPTPPIVKSKTENSVTLYYENGYEYSMDGNRWQKSTTFENLTPGTRYRFFRRIAETEDTLPSVSSAAVETVTNKMTNYETPLNPTLQKVTANRIEVREYRGYEYRIDGGNWVKTPVFENLKPNRTYLIEQRIAETDNTYASKTSEGLYVTTYKREVEQPSKPKLQSVSGKTVTLVKGEGLEYSMDGGMSFQSTPVFTVQGYGTYRFICRVAETETSYHSPNSSYIEVRVLPEELTSTTFFVDPQGSFVSGVTPGTTVSLFKKALGEGNYIEVKSKDGRILKENDLLMTGAYIEMPQGNKVYQVAVKGDLTGDGEVSMADIVLLKKHILDGEELNSLEFKAGDIGNDKSIGMADYVAMRNYILDGTAL